MKNKKIVVGLSFIVVILFILIWASEGEIGDNIIAFFKGEYCIFSSKIKIEELPNDRVIFGRLNITEFINNYPVNMSYTLYSIDYKGKDLRKIFSTIVEVSYDNDFRFSYPLFVLSPGKDWVLIQEYNYDEKKYEYEKILYVVRSDGTDFQSIYKFKDKIIPREFYLKWSLDNIAYFIHQDEWLAYNQETRELKGPYKNTDNITFAHKSGGTVSEYLPDIIPPIPSWSKNSVILSPKKDLIVYLIPRHEIRTEFLAPVGTKYLYLSTAKPDGSKKKRLNQLSPKMSIMEWTRDGNFIIVGNNGEVLGISTSDYWAYHGQRKSTENLTFNRLTGYEIHSVKKCGQPIPIVIK